MPDEFPINDPRKVWQDQPVEALKMSTGELRQKALQHYSRARSEALSSILISLALSVVFAWSITRAHTALARYGWGLLSLSVIYAAWHVYQWMWPRELAEDAPAGTCLEFYRRELERRRDYAGRWWKSGLPVLFSSGMIMAAIGTGAPKGPPPHPALAALPLLLLIAVWAVVWLVMKKKSGPTLQEEIDQLKAMEIDNRS